jgi:hypothetical protein
MYNEWLDMFGLESIWNDPDWPINEYKKDKNTNIKKESQNSEKSTK